MKRIIFFLTVGLVTVFSLTFNAGCKDTSKPKITRISISPACGVLPLPVSAIAFASGGDESGPPLGGNNNLEFAWNFGDGGAGGTSVAYHTFTQPGEYTVVVTATDPAGDSASASVPVTVLADSLSVTMSTNFPGGNVTTADVVQFDASALTCDVDYPAVIGDAVKLSFRWQMNDGTGRVFESSRPTYRFRTPGVYDVGLTVTYPAWAVTRRAALRLTVTAP